VVVGGGGGIRVEREPAVLLDLVGSAQVDDRAEPERTQRVDVGLGETVDAVGPEERLPLRGATVAGGISTQVAEVEDPFQLDVPGGLGHLGAVGRRRHVFDGIGAM